MQRVIRKNINLLLLWKQTCIDPGQAFDLTLWYGSRRRCSARRNSTFYSTPIV